MLPLILAHAVEAMEEDLASPLMLDGTVREITFSLATAEEIVRDDVSFLKIFSLMVVFFIYFYWRWNLWYGILGL